MKYVRTKDGIYKTRQCYPEETFFENVTYVYRHEFVKNKDILKQADTIEELCDKFIIHNKIETWIRTSWNSAKGTISIYKKVSEDFIQDVYGAIWTDKGLIYVAKMNDKGELELL